jgi:putative endonuclease
MYFIYILYSIPANKYYVGYTTDIDNRLHQHNNQEHFNTFTSKYRPWMVRALFSCGNNESEAIQIERFIKKQKSRTLLEHLTNKEFVPTGRLAQLVRVPHLRD